MLKIDFKLPIKEVHEIEKLAEELPSALFKAMKKAMLYTEGAAKRGMGKSGRPKVRTGTLRRNITSGVEMEGDSVTGWIGVISLIYSKILEIGGIIKPVTEEWLRFKIENQWVTVKEVVIPPYPYLEPAMDDSIEKIKDIILTNLVKDLEK